MSWCVVSRRPVRQLTEEDGSARVEACASEGSRMARHCARHGIRNLFLALLGVLLALPAAAKDKPPVLYKIPLPPQPDFSELDWLVGEWVGKTTTAGSPGEVHFVASFDLGKRFMVLREEVSLPAAKSAPASQESWLGILSASPDGSGHILRTFSSTGFIAQYRVMVDGPEIRFNPEGGEKLPPGWLFRRLIQRTDIGEFTENVQVAPPGKSFFDYYTAKLRRVRAPEKTGKDK
jgi:hypothetical protein